MFTGEIDAYILSHIDEEGDLLSALNRDANVNLLRPRMLSGHLQGRILKMFCRMIRPRRVLEIGTYTSYAYFVVWRKAMEEGALIHTIEINDEMEDFIMKYLSRSLHKDKIKVHFGDAMEIIPRLMRRSIWFLSMPTTPVFRVLLFGIPDGPSGRLDSRG